MASKLVSALHIAIEYVLSCAVGDEISYQLCFTVLTEMKRFIQCISTGRLVNTVPRKQMKGNPGTKTQTPYEEKEF